MSSPPVRATRKPTILYKLYRGGMMAALPLAWWTISRKLEQQGVSTERLRERLGQATLARPQGPLVWFHGASVGESLSVLTLVDALRQRLPGLQVLMTSGTATSAQILAKRMPEGCQHQFAPLDAPSTVARFLDHWRPDAGIFVDSEIWPNMLVMARQTGTRLALVNARLSRKSVEGWTKYPQTSAFILDQFDLIITQNPENADHLRRMGADEARLQSGINLKAVAKPLPVDEPELAKLRGLLAARPIWVAASTHMGEEETILAAHARIKRLYPDALLILVPRHPERGGEIAQLIELGNFRHARRSQGDTPGPNTDILLADTLGEMGLWYGLSEIVFVGGSLRAIGGHNPFEVASAGAAVISGRHVANFAETYAVMERIGAARMVETRNQLADAVKGLLDDRRTREAAIAAGRGFVDRFSDRLAAMTAELVLALDLSKPQAP